MHTLIPTLAAATALVAGLAAPTSAGADPGAEVTSGRFRATALGEERGHDVRGGAVMIRNDADGGRTIVVSVVRGLDPDTTYGSHVHDAPCAAGGGGHYQHEVGGDVDPVNEIWPTIRTNAHGNGRGVATHEHRARPDARSIVIHDPSDGGRIACLDLG